MNLDRFLKIRRPLEFWGWIALSLFIFVSGTLVKIIDGMRSNSSTQNWEFATWEATSIIAILLFIPLVLYFDRRFPIRWSNLKIAFPAHLAFSIVFSIAHVSVMVTLRKLIYWLNDSYYDFGIIVNQYFYEYLKDRRTYATILAIIYLYRHLVLRLQGEASLLSTPDINDAQEAEPKPERLLVKKLGREFLVKVDDIERIEAAGNYVNLHIAERVYPLRETLTKIEQQLDEAKFKRIHRSHIINLNYIEEIRPFENGDAQVLLTTGTPVPMSRTYRSQFIDNRW